MFFNIVHELFWCLNWGWFPSFGLGGIIHGGFCWDDETNVTSPSVNRGFYGENFLGNCYFETWWSNDLQQKTDIRQFFKTKQQIPFRMLSLGCTLNKKTSDPEGLKLGKSNVSWMSVGCYHLSLSIESNSTRSSLKESLMHNSQKCFRPWSVIRQEWMTDDNCSTFWGMKKGPAYPAVFLNEVCQHDFFGRMTLANGIYIWQLYEHNGP